jgi:hypothetical protein
VTPQAGRTRRDDARGQAVDLGAIRRTDAIVDLLASRGLPRPRALGDPAITLLSSLSADVDAPSGAPRDTSGAPGGTGTHRAPGAGPLSSTALSSTAPSSTALSSTALSHGGAATAYGAVHLAGPIGVAGCVPASGFEPERAGAAVRGAYRYAGSHRRGSAPWVHAAAAIMILAAAAVTAAGLMMTGMLMRVTGTSNLRGPRR